MTATLVAVGTSSFAVGVLGTVVVFALTRQARPVPLPSSPSLDPSAASPAASTSSAPRVGRSDYPPVEASARRALAKLRDGVETCTRTVIGVLPGTSPAVPVSFALMKGGVYTSISSDWRSPVYACVAYRETEPQPFQIQWQHGAAAGEGMGIAWLDDDKDGKPDRAFGFRATLVKKKEVTFGDIVPLDPLPKVFAVK